MARRSSREFVDLNVGTASHWIVKELAKTKSMRRKFYTILRENAKSLAIVPENTQMVALQQAGERPPFFMVDSYPYFIDVVRLTGTDQPVLSLIGYEETRSESYNIPDEANAHLKTILTHQPHGPYMLGGCSASGIVAYEIAQRLRALGHEVGLLVLFDTPNPYFMREYSDFWMSVTSYRTDLSKMRWSEVPGWMAEKFRGLKDRKPRWLPGTLNGSTRTASIMDQFGPTSPRVIAARRYRPAPYSGRFLLVKRERDLVGRYRDPNFGWGNIVQGVMEVCKVSAADHLEIFKSEVDRSTVAQRLRRSIDAVIEHHPAVCLRA
jgi:thioesterase domain-containing protein